MKIHTTNPLHTAGDYNFISFCKITLLLAGFLFSKNIYCQANSSDCKEIKDGIFYVYPKNSDSKFLIERMGDLQKETDLKTGDTSLFKVKWEKDCVYSLKFVSTSSKKDEETYKALAEKKITPLYQINSVTENYYVYSLYANKTSNLPLSQDTVWLHEKAEAGNNKFVELVTKEKDLRKPRFNDTSYALLYVYRPGKLTNFLANYPLYLNNQIVWVMKNKSGYIFKILKEGTYEIGSKLMNNASSTKLEVKLGQRYFVKSMIHWKVHWSRNFDLEMKVMPAETGEKEFESVVWNK